MQLSPDCVRDILFYVEDNTGYKTFADISQMLEALDYDANVIMYHTKQCELNGFFTKVNWHIGGYSGMIVDLTPKAHEFIANIRNDTNWNKIKDKAKMIGSVSLSILPQIATNYISSLIS